MCGEREKFFRPYPIPRQRPAPPSLHARRPPPRATRIQRVRSGLAERFRRSAPGAWASGRLGRSGPRHANRPDRSRTLRRKQRDSEPVGPSERVRAASSRERRAVRRDVASVSAAMRRFLLAGHLLLRPRALGSSRGPSASAESDVEQVRPTIRPAALRPLHWGLGTGRIRPALDALGRFPPDGAGHPPVLLTPKAVSHSASPHSDRLRSSLRRRMRAGRSSREGIRR